MSEGSTDVVIEFGFTGHALSLAVGVIAALTYRRMKGQPSPLLEAALVACVIYSANVVRLVLFPIMMNVADVQSIGAILAEVNLSPFRSGMRSEQVFQNMALTIPMGVFWRILFGNPSRRSVIAGILAAASLEIAQLATSMLIRTEYRSVDSLDLLLNVTG